MSGWVEVCALGEIDAEDVMPFEHGGRNYAIYRSPEDGYFATDGWCSHERALLCEGLVIGDLIECPKHNGRFNYKTGAAVRAPARVALRTHPVKVEDGRVYLQVG